jgi:hypothetical protein
MANKAAVDRLDDALGGEVVATVPNESRLSHGCNLSEDLRAAGRASAAEELRRSGR